MAWKCLQAEIAAEFAELSNHEDEVLDALNERVVRAMDRQRGWNSAWRLKELNKEWLAKRPTYWSEWRSKRSEEQRDRERERVRAKNRKLREDPEFRRKEAAKQRERDSTPEARARKAAWARAKRAAAKATSSGGQPPTPSP